MEKAVQGQNPSSLDVTMSQKRVRPAAGCSRLKQRLSRIDPGPVGFLDPATLIQYRKPLIEIAG